MDIQAKLKDSRKALVDCLGSQCIDEAGMYTSLLAYVRVLSARKKQEAYAIFTTEMANDVSAAKAEAIMKASDEHREYLIYEGYGEALLEQIRNFRAKGKGDDSEKQVTS